MRKKHEIWNIPNAMSFMRLVLLIPILFFMIKGMRYWALSLIILGVATDLLDGVIARRLNQCSDLGRAMDPVIDKINVLAVSLYMVISPEYHFPPWYFVLILMRELLLMIGGLTVIGKKRIVMESNKPGKRSAFVNGLVVLCFIMDWQPLGWILLGFGLALMFYSTFIYLHLFLNQISIIKHAKD